MVVGHTPSVEKDLREIPLRLAFGSQSDGSVVKETVALAEHLGSVPKTNSYGGS